MLWLLLACATTDSATPCSTSVTWINYADGFFAAYCRSCHSAAAVDRHGAPDGVDFDTEDEVWAQEAEIRRVVVDEATMPKGGGLDPDDLTLVDGWLRCAH